METPTCACKLLGGGRFNLSMGHLAKPIRRKPHVMASVNKLICTAAIVTAWSDLTKLSSCDLHDLPRPKGDNPLLYPYTDSCSDGPSKQVSLYFF